MSMWTKLPLGVLALATIGYLVKGDELKMSFAFALASSAVFFFVALLIKTVVERFKRH